jgi:hypothetical protein
MPADELKHSFLLIGSIAVNYLNFAAHVGF